jgi:hypothetical protein
MNGIYFQSARNSMVCAICTCVRAVTNYYAHPEEHHTLHTVTLGPKLLHEQVLKCTNNSCEIKPVTVATYTVTATVRPLYICTSQLPTSITKSKAKIEILKWPVWVLLANLTLCQNREIQTLSVAGIWNWKILSHIPKIYRLYTETGWTCQQT